ncbi:MAG: FAD binding domain-containing protein, partial [Mesorhizobium sp.]|nr:FAD binding domain-containing protein [Mesorhizobium sp.]
EAVVNVAGVHGRRALPINEFITGVKRTALGPGELIVSISVPVASGPQEFLKVGRRNAMVIALANLALIVDGDRRKVACALGSVGPTIIRCDEAEGLVARKVNWDRMRLDDPQVYQDFGELCANSARPINDHRATADYRRHAIAVLASRALMRTL